MNELWPWFGGTGDEVAEQVLAGQVVEYSQEDYAE